VILALSLAGLSACSGSSTPQTGEPSVTVGRPTSLAEVTLPLDAYLPAPEQQLVLLRAQDALTRTCMVRLGSSFPTYQRGVPAQDPVRSRRFGFVDAGSAARYGFATSPDVGNMARQGEAKSAKAALTSIQISLLYGQDVPPGSARLSTYQGQPVPVHGCAGEAQASLTQGAPKVDEGLVSRLMADSGAQTDQDKRVEALTQSWSRCMSKRGYSYGTPRAALYDQRWRATAGIPTAGGSQHAASPAEIAAAVATAQCQAEVNWLGVMAAVSTAYQSRLVDRNAEALKAVTVGLETQLRKAAAVVGAQ
jgi:hypothetical protein